MFLACMFNHLDEVDVVFPVPGEAEVVMHDFNYKRVIERVHVQVLVFATELTEILRKGSEDSVISVADLSISVRV